ncbi:hypothetical protein K7J14_14955 [Treponema zuelzerae]|uniref:Uncharacterized protein n=1 Tax=Teretinema zuelzerae TaxID=156 RepID=A0AAE3EKM1_9SPIR|nr:hypothetical protein [Teretinema zuelzerae]MCD1655996.1 hypothetical protein [Teretinema zuelzerae]
MEISNFFYLNRYGVLVFKYLVSPFLIITGLINIIIQADYFIILLSVFLMVFVFYVFPWYTSRQYRVLIRNNEISAKKILNKTEIYFKETDIKAVFYRSFHTNLGRLFLYQVCIELIDKKYICFCYYVDYQLKPFDNSPYQYNNYDILRKENDQFYYYTEGLGINLDKSKIIGKMKLFEKY